jgi:guanine nucleotide-binding protein subunit alpha, other
LAAGAGESGKSTVLKQMKLIYAQGFSKNEKNEWKPVIFGNIIQSFRLIFDAMNEMGIMLENEENEASNYHTQHTQPPIAAPSPFPRSRLPRGFRQRRGEAATRRQRTDRSR